MACRLIVTVSFFVPLSAQYQQAMDAASFLCAGIIYAPVMCWHVVYAVGAEPALMSCAGTLPVDVGDVAPSSPLNMLICNSQHFCLVIFKFVGSGTVHGR